MHLQEFGGKCQICELYAIRVTFGYLQCLAQAYRTVCSGVECIAWSGTLETLGLPESPDWIEGQRQDAE